jgi:hypothetical protein
LPDLGSSARHFISHRNAARNPLQPGAKQFTLPVNGLTVLLVVAADPQVIKEVARYFDEVPAASNGYTICGARLGECPYRLCFKA